MPSTEIVWLSSLFILRGLFKVSAWLAALCSRSGATIIVSQIFEAPFFRRIEQDSSGYGFEQRFFLKGLFLAFGHSYPRLNKYCNFFGLSTVPATNSFWRTIFRRAIETSVSWRAVNRALSEAMVPGEARASHLPKYNISEWLMVGGTGLEPVTLSLSS